MEAPQYPAGPYEADAVYGEVRRDEYITEIAAAPVRLRRAVTGLTAAQLETKCRNWTIRQITHHLADSHLNAYVRFKLALTEDRPTIKPYAWHGRHHTARGSCGCAGSGWGCQVDRAGFIERLHT